ncbi:MAG: T9SS type A sorting domain-containing protein, partial [Ignavibacteria bacterium]|nr:T9SS type A sorting domain-containing protein [Ignavibacteria bacterium]
DNTSSISEKNSAMIDDLILYQNYPNPFNSTTTIQFRILHSTFITLKVYDILGREVATLVNEEKAPGAYNYEFSPTFGGQSPNSELPSGVYIYQLRTGPYSISKKMIFVK